MVKAKKDKKKTTGPNCMKFPGLICHYLRTNRLDFGNDQVKGHGQRHRKVKNAFLSLHAQFCPIHIKPTPKCSLFNSLSSDMVTNVA